MITLPCTAYRVILADPPWRYEQRTNRHGAAEYHYQTAPVDALAAQLAPLLKQWADPAGCALCLWATFPTMQDALGLIRACGFRYRTALFTWVKLAANGQPIYGVGHYTRSNAEVCLLATRGKRAPHVKRHDLSSVLLTRRREHSRKPDEQYGRLMSLFDGPYLELFGRQAWPGWDMWGNEAGKFPAQPFLLSPDGYSVVAQGAPAAATTTPTRRAAKPKQRASVSV